MFRLSCCSKTKKVEPKEEIKRPHTPPVVVAQTHALATDIIGQDSSQSSSISALKESPKKDPIIVSGGTQPSGIILSA